jgi:glucose dehydrogenase
MDAGEEQAPPPMASDAESTDWELLGNSPDMQHHSGLSQINTETVSDLGLAWAIDLPTDWELLGNSLDMQHHSGLSQINTETVSDLGLAWAIDLPTRDGLIGNPLRRARSSRTT